MEDLRFAVLVYLVRYCPLASLVPFVRNCLLGFPLERCVLCPFDVAVPPYHGFVLGDVPLLL